MGKTTMDDEWYQARHPVQEGDTYRTPASFGRLSVVSIGPDGMVQVVAFDDQGQRVDAQAVPIDRAAWMVEKLYWVKA